MDLGVLERAASQAAAVEAGAMRAAFAVSGLGVLKPAAGGALAGAHTAAQREAATLGSTFGAAATKQVEPFIHNEAQMAAGGVIGLVLVLGGGFLLAMGLSKS